MYVKNFDFYTYYKSTWHRNVCQLKCKFTRLLWFPILTINYSINWYYILFFLEKTFSCYSFKKHYEKLDFFYFFLTFYRSYDWWVNQKNIRRNSSLCSILRCALTTRLKLEFKSDIFNWQNALEKQFTSLFWKEISEPHPAL